MQRLERCIGFLGGFLIEMNVLVGGGAGASATGGYGIRITDFLSVICVLLLTTRLYNPRRIVSITLYCLIVLAMFGPPLLSNDDRTVILALHYELCCFSGLYLSLLISEDAFPFCAGLILGLACSIVIFFLQDYGVPDETLTRWGLAPGFRPELYEGGRIMPRYSGLWSHPNEVGHVAALGAAAGAYWYFVRRKVYPLAIVFVCLMLAFNFCWSRGGFMAGMSVIALAILWPRNGKLGPTQVVGIVGLLAAFLILSQIDFVSSRFAADQNFEGNLSERLDTILQGFRVMLMNPVGLPVDEYLGELDSLTGGVGSPHNGFLFFGAIFGLFPLFALVGATVINLIVKDASDIFFAFLTAQILVSFQFEQLPGSYGYVLVICILLARAFVRSGIGNVLLQASPRSLVAAESKI